MKRRWFVSIVLLMSAAGLCLASESRIEFVTMQSQALGISKNFNIYLPQDYDESPDELYPVVYLFRGHEREWANPSEDGSRGGRNIKSVADELYEGGLIGKMILVMPGLSSNDNAIPGLGVNFVDVSLAGAKTGLGTGHFEDFLVNDLVPYIDERYRTIPSRSQRGVDGFSLGGYTSMLMATKHAELFCSAGAYDGTMMWKDLDDPRSPGSRDDNTWLRTGMFDPAFGSPRDIEAMLQYNPANLVAEAAAERLALLQSSRFMIHSAGSEALGNLNRSQHMVDLLAEQGMQNTFSDIRLASNAQHNWWYADEHMRITLPLHWDAFAHPVNTISLEVVAPLPGSVLSGQVEIRWSPPVEEESVLTVLSYSRDGGSTWHLFSTAYSNDTTFLWDTGTVPDGTRYLVRVFVAGGTTVAVSQSEERCTIDNPGNGAPDIEILSPDEWDVLAGEWVIRWFADDAEGNDLAFSMAYSADNGGHWELLFTDLSNESTHMWNTALYPNSAIYRLILYCSDDSATVSDTSAIFTLFNERQVIDDENIAHVSGHGSARITAHIVDAEQVTGDLYRLTFNDTLFAYTVYDVLNVDTGEQLIEQAAELDGATEGPYFDGIRLLVRDFDQAEIDHASTGWMTGSSTLEIHISLPSIDIGTEVLEGIPYPADYRITMSDHVVDTSSSAYGAAVVPMMFSIWNLTEDVRAEAIFLDADNNRTLSRLDELFLLIPDGEQPPLTWSIYCGGQPGAVNPEPGDEFVLRTLKPLTGQDVYEFRASEDDPICALPGDANEDGAVNVMDVVSVVNSILNLNPDPFDMACADCDGNGVVNVLDALGIVNAILGLGDCTPGACSATMTPEARGILTSLKSYLSPQDYDRFMALVRATFCPDECHLAQNYPNPFNPATSIQFAVGSGQSPVHTTLRVYNILGQEVATLVDEVKEAGDYAVMWDASDVPSGVYFCRIKAGDFAAVKKMILMR